ncbi:helix-turn-helix domain-containing protein [Monashia sp. NPDC004114]
MSKLPLPDLGAYLREQRENAQLSLRQLADLAGISNPYLSQIERGLKRPSAEILQQIAKGLKVSAESLYVRAGFLDERVLNDDPAAARDVLAAIAADPVLTERQRGVLVEIYLSFVGEHAPAPQTPQRAEAAMATDAIAPIGHTGATESSSGRARRALRSLRDTAATPTDVNEKEN